MDQLIITIADVRAVRFCSRGAREWLARYGFDWQSFLAYGLPASVLEATGDALAFRVTEAARGRRQ